MPQRFSQFNENINKAGLAWKVGRDNERPSKDLRAATKTILEAIGIKNSAPMIRTHPVVYSVGGQALMYVDKDGNPKEWGRGGVKLVGEKDRKEYSKNDFDGYEEFVAEYFNNNNQIVWRFSMNSPGTGGRGRLLCSVSVGPARLEKLARLRDLSSTWESQVGYNGSFKDL